MEKVESAEERRQRHNRLRQNVLVEIVRTEREYVDDCEIMVQVFLMPLKFQQKMLGITKLDMDTLFSGMESIISLSKLFLQDLENRQRQSMSAASGGSVSVGDIFITLVCVGVVFKLCVCVCVCGVLFCFFVLFFFFKVAE
jgi:RhoGEF domain